MFLAELVRLDGRGDFQGGTCCVCHATGKHKLSCLTLIALLISLGSLYRCVECFEGSLKCGNCISSAHRQNPFHRIQVSPRITRSSSVSSRVSGVDRQLFQEEQSPRSWARRPTWTLSPRPLYQPGTKHPGIHSPPRQRHSCR